MQANEQLFCVLKSFFSYMSVKERIKAFIKYKKLSDRAFCIGVGLSPTYVSSMKVSIQPDKVNKIAVCFPELNTGWLMTGEGEMLKTNENKTQSTPEEFEKLPAGTGMVTFLMEQNRSLEKIIHDQNTIMIDQNDIIKCQLKRITDLEAELDRAKNASTAPEKAAECAAAS